MVATKEERKTMTRVEAIRAIYHTPLSEFVSETLIQRAVQYDWYEGTRSRKSVVREAEGGTPALFENVVGYCSRGFSLSTGGSVDGTRSYTTEFEMTDRVEWVAEVGEITAGDLLVGALWENPGWSFNAYRVYADPDGDLRVSSYWHTSYALSRLRVVGRIVRIQRTESNMTGIKVAATIPVYDVRDHPSKRERLSARSRGR